MRKIRGWILNLTDAEGPEPGTAEVSALLNDSTDLSESTGRLDLEEHTLGYLDRTHQIGGSGSPTHADGNGHFGWDMEFSPGPITTRIVASDPAPTQHRARFPDESAQIGKAFHSDLERLGWAAGRDCLIYGAIEGAAQPDAAAWGAGSPTDTARLGDWGIADFGTGADAGRVLLNRGIGFLGGVLFSIETPNYPLLVPVLGEAAAEPNSGATDRWDLLYAYMNIEPPNPASPTASLYGKQGIRIQSGGATIPTLNQVSTERRMVIHALKMPAGGGAYTTASDLRPWTAQPQQRSLQGVVSKAATPVQGVESATEVNSTLNTALRTAELTLSPALAWEGMVTFSCVVESPDATGTGVQRFDLGVRVLSEGRVDVEELAIEGTDYVINPPAGHYQVHLLRQGSDIDSVNASFTFPLRSIPSFHADGAVGVTTRDWTRLRFAVKFTGLGFGGTPLRVRNQALTYSLWPAP